MEEFNEEAIRRFEEMIRDNEAVFFDSTEYEDIIDYYLQIGDYQYAELALKYAFKIFPEVLGIKIKQFEFLVDKNDYKAAKTLMLELAEIAKDDIDYLICCANYYSDLGNPKRAIKYCHQALRLDEDQAFLHNFMADEYQNLNDPFSALKHYKLALNADPSDDYALQSVMQCFGDINRSDKALEFINAFLDQYPYCETAWLEYGTFQFNEKNYKEAIKGFDYLLAVNDKSIGGYTYKAACYEAMNQWKKAIEVYKDSQEFEFTKSYSFFKIGQCYIKMKKLSAALSVLQKALYEDPQFYPAMIEISEVYQKLGDFKLAIQFAKDAVRLNEDDLELQKRLSFLYVTTGDLDAALICLKRMVDKEPQVFYNWYVYAEVLILREDYKKAIQILTVATKKFNRAESFYQLSNCYFNNHQEQAGQDALVQAVMLDPTLLKEMQVKYPYLAKEVRRIKFRTE